VDITHDLIMQLTALTGALEEDSIDFPPSSGC
jgi:hypothetical protein